MKNEQIKNIKEQLIQAQEGDYETQITALKSLVETLGLSSAFKDGSNSELFVQRMVEKINCYLQTEIMINTVKVAKWSCFWAAVAAIASLATALLSVLLHFRTC